jgi:hypothetical protein
VRGTVRDPKNEERVGPIKTSFGEEFNKIDLDGDNIADLMVFDSFDANEEINILTSELIDKYGVPDIILCSPFLRTRQTTEKIIRL